MTVVVLGAGGQVGRAVIAAAPADTVLKSFAREHLDITDEIAVEQTLVPLAPHWIINCAAFTAVDLAQTQADRASALNDGAVRTLARIARQVRARLLHVSTDFVFNGASNRAYLPTDPPAPLNVYGASKLAGERHVLDDSTGIVVRTSWVYSATGQNFLLTMLRLMSERDKLRVVCDQIGSPTSAGSLANAIWKAVGIELTGGIYHWSDDGVASWYDFAVAIQEEALHRSMVLRRVPIRSIRSPDFPTAAQRPAMSLLNCDSTRAALQWYPEHWRVNLRTVLDELAMSRAGMHQESR